MFVRKLGWEIFGQLFLANGVFLKKQIKNKTLKKQNTEKRQKKSAKRFFTKGRYFIFRKSCAESTFYVFVNNLFHHGKKKVES